MTIRNLRIAGCCCTAAAVIAVAIMAFRSPFDAHPDEWTHIAAGRYYMTHDAPPVVGDPATFPSYSVHGLSRLMNSGLSHFLAAKLALVVMPFIRNDVVSLRLFNVLLFLILSGILAVQCVRKHPASIVLLMLLATPMAWYVFSYCNDDALPLFLSFIAVMLLLPRPGMQTADDRSFLLQRSRITLLGVILGLISIEKLNYLFFIGFVIALLVYRSVVQVRQNTSSPSSRPVFRVLTPYLSVALVALGIFCIRHGYDIAQNGIDRDAKRLAVQEARAAVDFKPSLIRAAPSAAYRSLNLRGKGVPISDMLFSRQYAWFMKTFASFTGAYGYFTVRHHPAYHVIMLLAYLAMAFFLLPTLCAARTADVRAIALAGILAAALLLGASIYNSWVIDFQPQGRYLFPLLPIAGLQLYSLRSVIGKHIPMLLTACVIAAMSLYSFIGLAVPSLCVWQ